MQEILTYSVLALTLCYAGWKLFRMFLPEKKNEVGCSSGCGCDTVKLKKEILDRKLLNMPVKETVPPVVKSQI
ncbi:MAG: hypothetical protein IPH45_01520 [Bacteroidales bacterium]|nr:hypothetical protein [Bacteroidales bacterium]